ncbi:hypothetical protein DP065_00235 [[Mycoplasma] anseris]|uniref:Uncharacterized protein n=1 Tax=[Mycoplasma] anseris TaxID=92400 RepID=A0A2Z4NCB6_9BACT|nr:hypothetical protein DP065_00235 [[Mycoplasma] anseris]
MSNNEDFYERYLCSAKQIYNSCYLKNHILLKVYILKKYETILWKQKIINLNTFKITKFKL